MLPLLQRIPIELVIVDVVEEEAVDTGLAGGHVDAVAIEAAIAALPRRVADVDGRAADARVLDAARDAGTLVANDLALGRRAKNLGIRWLRTADLVVLAARTSSLPAAEARQAIVSLESAGRITADLASQYLAELS